MVNKSIICTTYFSKKKHPNDPNDKYVTGRSEDGTVVQNSIKYIEPWYNSINKLKLTGLVFYDNLSDNFIDKYQTNYVRFYKVESSDYSNNDWRFFCYRNYFEDHKYDHVFLTDGSDVTIVNDPSLCIEKYKYIDYFICKDSIKLSQFPYLNIHNQAQWDNLHWFIKNHKNLDLINMGVIGATYDNICEFLKLFCQTRINLGNPDFNSDMWLGQYIFRHLLSHKNLMIGNPFTSDFKQYQNERQDVYFIHK